MWMRTREVCPSRSASRSILLGSYLRAGGDHVDSGCGLRGGVGDLDHAVCELSNWPAGSVRVAGEGFAVSSDTASSPPRAAEALG